MKKVIKTNRGIIESAEMSSQYSRPSNSMDIRCNGLDEPEIYLRKRIRDPSPDDSLEAGELSDALSEDEDVPGCPLPSTPEDTELLEAEVNFIASF